MTRFPHALFPILVLLLLFSACAREEVPPQKTADSSPVGEREAVDTRDEMLAKAHAHKKI